MDDGVLGTFQFQRRGQIEVAAAEVILHGNML